MATVRKQQLWGGEQLQGGRPEQARGSRLGRQRQGVSRDHTRSPFQGEEGAPFLMGRQGVVPAQKRKEMLRELTGEAEGRGYDPNDSIY